MPRSPDIARKEDLAQAEIMRLHSLDHSMIYRVEVGETRTDGSFPFTAEVVREYEMGGRWHWFHGTIAPGGASTVDALEPHSFGPEGADVKVVRAQRRALGRPVLDEDRVSFAEAALRRHIQDLPRFAITRVARERIDGNATVFDFATLGWQGHAPRIGIWYVGTARVDLDTWVTRVEVREHPKSRTMQWWDKEKSSAHDASMEEAWVEIGFPSTEWFLSESQKRERLTAALHEIDPLFAASQLGHVNLHGEADRTGTFYFAAEVWRDSETGGSVRWYHGALAPEGKSKIECTEPLVYGAEGVDVVALRRGRSARNLELLGPVVRRSMVDSLLPSSGAPTKIRTSDEWRLSGLTHFDFAALRPEALYTGSVRYNLESNTFVGDLKEHRVPEAAEERVWAEQGFGRPELPRGRAEPLGATPSTRGMDVGPLWKQVRAQPRNLELRLALAKELERQGSPQGELIRLCCSPALGPAGSREARIKQLLAADGKTWYPPPPREPSYWNTARYLDGKGIPDVLYPSGDGLADLAWWVDRYPLRHVWLLGVHDWTPLFRALEAGGHFARLGHLTVTEALMPRPALAALGAGSPGIEQLDLGLLNKFDPRDLAALAEGELLTGVKTLNLHFGTLDAAAFEAVWSKAKALEHLRTTDTNLGEAALNLRRHNAPKLQSVTIASGWNEAQVLALWNAIDPVALREFRATRVGLGNAFLRAVAASAGNGGLEALEVLDLGRNSIQDLRGFLATPPPNLRVLRLESNELDERQLSELTQHPLLGRLRELGISKNRVISGYEDVSAFGYDPVAVEVRKDAEQMRAHFSLPPDLVVV